MIQCKACHYTALGPIDLAGHLMAAHGFNRQAAMAEAGEITSVFLPTDPGIADSLAYSLHDETIRNVGELVADLRAQLAAVTAERDALKEEVAQLQAHIAEEDEAWRTWREALRAQNEAWPKDRTP